MITSTLDRWPAPSMQVAAQIGAEPSELEVMLGVSFREVDGDHFYLAKMSRDYYVVLVKVPGNPQSGVSLMYHGDHTPTQVVQDFVEESGLDPSLVLWVAGEASREEWWRATGM